MSFASRCICSHSSSHFTWFCFLHRLKHFVRTRVAAFLMRNVQKKRMNKQLTEKKHCLIDMRVISMPSIQSFTIQSLENKKREKSLRVQHTSLAAHSENCIRKMRCDTYGMIFYVVLLFTILKLCIIFSFLFSCVVRFSFSSHSMLDTGGRAQCVVLLFRNTLTSAGALLVCVCVHAC